MVTTTAYRCLQPWQTMMIDAAGVVQPCAYRGNYTNTVNAEPFGNVNDASLDEIWNGSVARRVRQCLIDGDLLGAGCSECLALKQGHKLGLEVASPIVAGTPYAANVQLKTEEIAAGKTTIESRPLVLYYTPSHHCNLRCIHCYQGTSRSQSIRSEADAQVLDLLPYLSDIVAGGGEPLILPVWRTLLESFDPAVNPHLRFCTTTNATVLRDDVLGGLARMPRMGLIVSIDGIGKTFEQIRERADWPSFLENLRTLRRLAGQRQSAFGLNVSVMQQNVHELADLVELAEDLETLVNFQPVVSYPVDCSLRCFNAPPEGWRDAFARAESALEKLVSKLQAAGSRFVGWDNLWSFSSQLLQAKAASDLVPWHVLDRPHERVRLSVPPLNRMAVDYVWQYSREQNWPRQTAVVVLAEKGRQEPHWWAPIEPNYEYEVSLPTGDFDAWIVQIDSVPLTAGYAQANGVAWEVVR